ncbi:uncharacterized protein MELLADRAFT_68209 [Melampsora larici-populina 98AG31]|uniref:Uncharacterized protein n=1 Tax=Melampsora larici-populina (strain 98AG31 / pathotype 3-4-7) TaxID=747676 RepID=F4S5Z0_MELLP|nr:uncharacterized protein MELLADRAFT_68209 [Melampsora larici-populina 98AG31]EGF99936.1 hypothetical protein MELLADRAFT_68209 [Melampsora larici-populina 98AG31]
MQPHKPRATSRSKPAGDYLKLQPRPRTCHNRTIRSGLDWYPRCTDIHDFVPLPLAYLAPPTPGFDFNPNSLRYVRDVSCNPPDFGDRHPLCITLPKKAGIENELVFAMCTSSRWVTKGRRFNGTLHLPSGEVKAPKPPASNKRGPKRMHLWTEIYNCNASGNPCTQKKSTLTELARQSSGSIKVQCPARFLLKKTLTGKMEFEWYWKHENHNPFSVEDMCNMHMPQVVKSWLNGRILEGLTWRTIQRLLRCPDLFPVCYIPFP